MANSVLHVENLTKSYGNVQAVRGISFAVEEGEVFGLLGPNGAGKTSTVEILEGLRNADGGTVSVCGYDPQKNPDELKHEIGAALQSTALPDKLRVMEALKLFASFYHRKRNPEDLLKRFGLEEKRNAFYSQLSGGQKQRLALAASARKSGRTSRCPGSATCRSRRRADQQSVVPVPGCKVRSATLPSPLRTREIAGRELRSRPSRRRHWPGWLPWS